MYCLILFSFFIENVLIFPCVSPCVFPQMQSACNQLMKRPGPNRKADFISHLTKLSLLLQNIKSMPSQTRRLFILEPQERRAELGL